MSGIHKKIVLEINLIQNGEFSRKFCPRNFSNPIWENTKIMFKKLF